MKYLFTSLLSFFLLFNVVKSQTQKNILFDSKELISTFLGGSGDDEFYEPSMAIGPDGSIYITGSTKSSNFPVTEGCYDKYFNGGIDRFICKFDPELKTLLASSFVGGTKNDIGMGIAVDEAGNVFLAGYTLSSDFPTSSNGYDRSFNGVTDAFVLKMDGDLTTVISSTYFGGTSHEIYSGSDNQTFPRIDIAIGNEGDVYIAGITSSSDLPVSSNAYDKSYSSSGGWQDCFVAKFDSDLSVLKAATYLGGYEDEWRPSILVDEDENVYVAGSTRAGFPTTSNAYDQSHNGHYDGFISKLSGDLSTLKASTYLGGNMPEDLLGIRFDESGNIVVVGYTSSSEFPVTSGAYNTTFGGGYAIDDCFISKLDKDLTKVIASTFIGSTNVDKAEDIEIDQAGNIYVVGHTYSSNYPTTSDSYDNSHNGGQDVILSVFNNKLSALLSSTYIGGSKNERGQCVVINSNNDLYIGGRTVSSNFPTSIGVFDESFNGGTKYGDCFISKFNYSEFLTDVEKNDELSLPAKFQLNNNYPNPFNPSTTISFSLNEESYISLRIFDSLGRLVSILKEGNYQTGNYEVSWNGRYSNGCQAGSGVYFCQLQTNDKTDIIKMNLIK